MRNWSTLPVILSAGMKSSAETVVGNTRGCPLKGIKTKQFGLICLTLIDFLNVADLNPGGRAHSFLILVTSVKKERLVHISPVRSSANKQSLSLIAARRGRDRIGPAEEAEKTSGTRCCFSPVSDVAGSRGSALLGSPVWQPVRQTENREGNDSQKSKPLHH